MDEDHIYSVSGADILDMIADSHLITAGILERAGIYSMEGQAELIEGLSADPNPAITALRELLVKSLRYGRPNLSLIPGGRDSDEG